MPTISPQNETSSFVNFNGPKSEIQEFLSLTFSLAGKQIQVPVYVGSLYKVTYFNPDRQIYETISGMVTGISDKYIAMEAIIFREGMETACVCDNRDFLTSILSGKTFHIIVSNIKAINAIDTRPPEPVPPPIPKERRVEFVSVLGISSTIVRAIIVRLRIYGDDVRHTVTDVNMEVGHSYRVSYCSHDRDHTMYEIEGRLIRIEEIGQFGDEPPCDGYVRPDIYPPEEVGNSGNIYDPNYYYSLDKHNPDAHRIKFVFDTSKAFEYYHDHVMLADIRNVIEIPGEPMPDPDVGPDPYHPFPPHPPMDPDAIPDEYAPGFPPPPKPVPPPSHPFPPAPPCPCPDPCPWPPAPTPGDWPPGPQPTCNWIINEENTGVGSISGCTDGTDHS